MITAGSDEDDVFGTIGFLNEAALRYPEAISLAPGAPLLTGITRERLIRAVDEVAPQGWDGLFQYGPSQGIVNNHLANALAVTQGLDVSADDLTITVGAQEGFVLLLRALGLHQAGTLGIVAPAFAGIRGAAAFMGVRIVDLHEGVHGLDVAVFREAVRRARMDGEPLRAAYVAPDFSNPSGTVMPESGRLALLAAAEEHGVLLVEDATYGFTGAGTPPSLKALDKHSTVVQVGTFSKICLPGVRVGYVVADQRRGSISLAKWLSTLKNMTTVNTSPITQAMVAGLLLLNPRELVDRCCSLAAAYAVKRDLLLCALEDEFDPYTEPRVRWNRPQGGFFVIVETPWQMDRAALERSATRHGVLWTPMRDFYAGEHGDRALRLSCSQATDDQIREGVRRLGRFLRETAAQEAS